MKKYLTVLIVLLALVSSVNALIQPEKTVISISGNEPYSVPVKIVNESEEKQMVHLISSSVLETEFAANDFYLNAGEETIIALNIMPYYNYKTFLVELQAEFDSFTEYSELTVIIGNSSGQVNLRYYKQNICQDKLDKLSLWIKNDSSEKKRIYLSADSETFLPTINPTELNLNAGEEKFVELELNSNKSFPIDKEYSVVVHLETEDSIVSREIFFYLTECLDLEKEKRFSLSLLDNFSSIRKGDTERIYFEVRNFDEEENEITFAVKSDLRTELQQTKTVLEENQRRRYWIDIKALKSDETGEHKIELYAFNPFYEEKKVFYIDVRGIHEIETTLLNDNLEIERGHSKIFTLLIENKGDFEERIKIESFNEENINLHFSENNFYLAGKEDKKVYISVNPGIDSELGEKEIRIKVDGKEIFLNFTVIKETKPLLTSGVIDFLSVAEKVTLSQKETKISVSIKNISGEKIENIVFWIEGLPKGVSFESSIAEEINNDKTRVFEGKLILDEETEKGSYDITLVFENQKFRQKKTIQLIVSEETEKETEKEKGITTGFFGLGSGELIGLIVIALIMLIVLFSPKKDKPKWLNKGGEKNE